MKQGNIKNIILIVMVLVCVYLSSNVWLKLPHFISNASTEGDGENNELPILDDIWNIVRPVKNVIKYEENYTITYTDEQDIWGKTVLAINDAFAEFNLSSINEDAAFPADYIKFDFKTNIPVDIFMGHMNIDNENVKNTVKNIKNVIVDLENPKVIYIYNGEDTVSIQNEKINTQEIAEIVKQINFNNETKYTFEQKILGETINVPIPLEQTALNPIFVQSELDVFDTETINQIAKKYFKSNYDYVRKSVEVSGNTVFMYRSDKILKINADGLLDFYDTTAEIDSSSDVYKSLVSAVKFTKEFLGFPENGFLDNIETINHEGNFGYRFTFSYKIKERPILFSKVRANSALQVDVVGDSVISYKRFIRNINESQLDKMNEINIMSAMDVIEGNIESDTPIKDESETIELKPLKKQMLGEINNIYLGYFDLSRISKEQLLRVVWVVEMKDKAYIFNAISGALIEEWQ